MTKLRNTVCSTKSNEMNILIWLWNDSKGSSKGENLKFLWLVTVWGKCILSQVIQWRALLIGIMRASLFYQKPFSVLDNNFTINNLKWNNKIKHLCRTYCIPGTVHFVSIHFHITTLWSKLYYYHQHFIDEEREAWAKM